MRQHPRLHRRAHRSALAIAVLLACACGTRERDTHENPSQVDEKDRAPERFLPAGLALRSDSVVLRNAKHVFDTDEGLQPDTLPALPPGVTLDNVRRGDDLFHGVGGCRNCHGAEAQGLAARGSSLTNGLHLIPGDDVRGMDSIIVSGIPDAETRSPIAMPPRGQNGNLTTSETHALAAYVWAISSTRGEPWPGGHISHGQHDANGSARTDIP